MKKDSKTNQSTEEQKKEELKNEIRSYLNDYQSINEDTTITENTKMVLSMLLYTGNGQDKFTIGYRYIEEVTGISKNSISPIVGKLEKKGFINRTKGTRGKNSEYTLNYETMESYVSNCPSVQVSKCTTKKHKKGVQVSKCPSVQPNETTCTPTCTVTCTVKDTDIQLLIKQNEEKIQLNKRTNELLEKLCNLYINNNINNNINKNLKDIISSNNNTEGNNTEEKNNIKEKYTKDNLEKLKENSNDEIFNDEDIQRENESLNENENTSKVESSKDEISNESRIPSDEGNISDNENPSDYPPLDVDGFFEDSNSTEYRTNENLNEENENSKENENPSKANGSSKDDEGLSEDKKPSDENPKANENPEDDEMDCSVFGDSNSTDEDNDKWYESSSSAKSDNHANGMFTNLISELTSNNPKTNEISNDNNSKTSENMKKTKISTNTIPSETKNPSDEKTLKNLNAFGKLQSFRDLKTGCIDGYQFNSYDNLNDSRDYSKSFHASVLCLNLEPSDLKASVSDTGTWGMLSRKDGVYSFTASTTDLSDCKYIAQQHSLSLEKKGGAAADDENTSNNGTQATKTAAVDNNTTEGEIIAPEQSQIANKASECNNDTTADNKKDEKTTETVYADEKNAEVDNYTTDDEKTAGNSVKMRPEPSDSNTNTTDTPNNSTQAPKTSEVDSNTTNTEKVAPEQSQIANKASNAGVLDGLDGKTKAMIEELMKRDAAKKVTPMGRDYFKGAPDRWKEIHLKCAYAGGNNGDLLTIEEAIENYSSYESPRLHLDAIRTYAEEICKRMRKVLDDNVITQEQFNDFSDVFKFKSEGYKAACAEEFKKNKPTTESEKWMYNWIYKKKKNVKN